ncbi:cysteine proteinase [Coprinopsis marcescibilis]|uniref:Ubiquitin carboxyl-terminal hydrolase n=1 Tax=Coprinopsis marcescibilis TaxID=230819 RepID=A0A5C3L3M7_COPMA|nr:cysteine proteinase [Coprinopsis marcescibilis]
MLEQGSTCPHIKAELGENGTTIITKYKTVLAWNVNRLQAVRTSAKRRRIAAPSCGACGLALSRPLACLHCEFTGCWDNQHALEHLRDAEHSFCADVKTGAIFCSQCNDFIYDAEMEEISLEAILGAEEKQTRFQVSQKLREPFKRWTPDEKEAAAAENFVSRPCQSRRGLVNLGQTCFLNAVLQSLIHNPLLRNYFLSDKHNWRQCKLETCTCCEMDRLFTEIYSEDDTPYCPTTFLYNLWRTSELSGYAQHDAHECFIATLNQIHSTSRGSTNVSCNCIIHNTFGGQLQSDVRCERCGNTTTAIDPILDISLELKTKGGDLASAENTLAACLRRFTLPEKLGVKEYTCTKCTKIAHEASKRMSIRQLPPVLSFQFKRFEQKTNDKTSTRKLDTPVRIPASINMAPYTSALVREMDKETGSGAGAGVPFVYPGPEILYEYDLFGVINHEGQIDNGHYTNFARFEDEWYRFDDDKVTHSSLGACLSSNVYMCFYAKRHLDYKPYMTPTYIREMEKKEKEKEREKERAEKDGTGKGKEKSKDKDVVMREIDDALLATV